MTSPALALDALMRHPRYPEYVDLMRGVAPVGLLDQADSASTEAHGILTAGAAWLGAEDGPRPAAASDIPDWLRLGLLDAFTGYALGRSNTCAHNPDPWHPSPVMAAAWHAGLVVCPACVHLLALPRGSAKDRACDACGHECDGVEHGDGVYPGMVQLGPLIYQYGTCGQCVPPTTSAGPLRATQRAEQALPRGTGRVKRQKPRTRRGRSRGRGQR